VEPTVLQLMEELLQSIEQRDAADPDAPPWEATIRIQRLEEELARRLRGAGVGDRAAMVADRGQLPDEVLVGVA
jgi:hypothetical protein